MANILKIKRGTAATIPQGQLAEPLFTTDTYDLYIGKGSGGNQRIQKYITSGTSSQFLKGDGSLDSNTYEPSITAGTTLQYWRGDKSWQTLDTNVVPENGPIYFTEPRVLATVLTGLNLSGGGTIAATDSVLTAFGKVQNQISALVGGVFYKGVWNASTNNPTLTSSTGTKGWYYVVNVAGSTNLDGITDWKVGDWAIFNGTTWDKVDNTDAVSSVNGFTGAVNLGLGDISNVTLTSPTNNQLIKFDGTTSKWINFTPAYEPTLTKGNLTEATSSVLTITGGTGAVIGSGTTIEVKSASATQNGVVTTGTQTFAGIKTFSDEITLGESTGTPQTLINYPGGWKNLYKETPGALYGFNLGTTSTESLFWIAEEATNHQVMVLSDGATTDNIWGISTSSDSGTTWGARLVVNQNGNVGIGKNNPSTLLDVAGAGTFSGALTATKYLVGSPSDSTRSFAAGGNANDIAIYLEEYGASTATPDVFFVKGRGTVSAKLNVAVGDGLGGISFSGYLNSVIYNSVTIGTEVVNLNTTDNFADADIIFKQSYNSTTLTENFRLTANGGNLTVKGTIKGTINSLSTASNAFVVSDSGTLKYRTAANVLSDIAALPLAGGTLTGALSGTSATFSGDLTASGKVYFGTFNGSKKYYFEPFSNLAGGANNAYFVSGSVSNSERSGFVFNARNSAGTEYNAVIIEGYNSTSTTPALSISSTGAATFSSSVTAGVSTSSGYATINLIDSGTGSARYASIRKNYDSPYDLRIRASNSENEAPIIFDLSNDTEAMRITSGGNVGIGTTSPQGAFEAVGLSYFTRSSKSLLVNPNYGGADTHAQLQVVGNMALAFATNGDNERMRITSGGNVGINTSGPTVTSTPHLFIGTNMSMFNGASDDSYIGSNFYYNSAWYYRTANAASMIQQNGGEFYFKNAGIGTANGALTWTERMCITTGGNVIIGNAGSAISTRQELRITGNTGGSRISLGLNGTNYSALVTDSGGSVYLTNEYNDSAIKLLMINYNNGVYLSQSATSWTSNSDIRLKNIIGNIENAVSSLMTLRTVKYSWKSDINNKENLGLIAQDVEQVYPEVMDKNKLINSDDDTEYLGVRYQELVPVLVKAIQEQQAQIEELKLKLS